MFCGCASRVTFNYLKHMYAAGDKKEAFERLRVFTEGLPGDDAALQARCYLTMGQWESELNDNLSETNILALFKAATEYDDDWYKAWHSWALSNFEVITHYQKLAQPDKITPHLVPAVAGFFRSIALAPQGKSLQDTLRHACTRVSCRVRVCVCGCACVVSNACAHNGQAADAVVQVRRQEEGRGGPDRGLQHGLDRHVAPGRAAAHRPHPLAGAQRGLHGARPAHQRGPRAPPGPRLPALRRL